MFKSHIFSLQIFNVLFTLSVNLLLYILSSSLYFQNSKSFQKWNTFKNTVYGKYKLVFNKERGEVYMYK